MSEDNAGPDDSAVPPYEGRTTESTASRDMEDSAHARDVPEGTGGSGDDGGPDVSSPDDFPPEGVGESQSRRGEDIAEDDGKEAGRYEEGTKGATDRPEGDSDTRDISGV